MDRVEITTRILSAIISNSEPIRSPEGAFSQALRYTNLIANYYGLDNCPIEDEKSNLNEDRVIEMAELEDGCDVSVGGLINKEKHGWEFLDEEPNLYDEFDKEFS